MDAKLQKELNACQSAKERMIVFPQCELTQIQLFSSQDLLSGVHDDISYNLEKRDIIIKITALFYDKRSNKERLIRLTARPCVTSCREIISLESLPLGAS